jgi:hypothetical protein
MSSAVDTTTMTIPQQTVQATHNLCSALGLGVLNASQLRYLTLALTQVAAQEAGQSPTFADQVRARYLELAPMKPSRQTSGAGRTSSRRSAGANRVKLVPVGTVDEALLDPYAPPNPFALQQLYGNEQLALALDRYTATKLKEAVTVVKDRFPGTKPKRQTKPGIIEYIVGMLTGSASV